MLPSNRHGSAVPSIFSALCRRTAAITPNFVHIRRGRSVAAGGAPFASADAMVVVRLAKMKIAEARRWVGRRVTLRRLRSASFLK